MMTDPKFIDVEGIRTRYFDQGRGEVLLLVHGSHFGTPDACESALDWEFNFAPLAERYRVIAMDKLGQGYTDNPQSDADYTMAATVNMRPACCRRSVFERFTSSATRAAVTWLLALL